MHARASLLVNALLLVGAVVTLVPLAWMLGASFMSTGDASSLPPRFVPAVPTLEHYRVLFTRLDLLRNLINSLVISLSAMIISVLLNSMAGYAFGKLRFRGRDRVFRILVAALVVPAQVGMLPLFLLLKEMGFVNTYVGVLIPSMTSVFGIFLVRQYVQSLPDELLDAARVDGASEFRIFWSIVLPLIRPIVVTLAVFSLLTTWNDFMWPLIILTDSAKYTLPVALANLSREHVQDTELMMAGAVLTVTPILIAFLFLQRQYFRGILAGSVKG